MKVFKNVLLFVRSNGRYTRRKNIAQPFPMKFLGTSIELTGLGAGSTAAYCEVYIDDFYDLRKLRREALGTIVDVGANVGMFSCFAHLCFPQAQIYAYEPNAAAFRHLESNTRNMGISLYQTAVGEEDGFSSFEMGNDTTLGFLSDTGASQVKVVGSKQLAEGKFIDLLKMDCEGGEWRILRDAALLNRTKILVMEYHLVADRKLGDLVTLLSAGGHEVKTLRECTAFHGFIKSIKIGQSPA